MGGIGHWMTVRCHPMLGQGVTATEGKQQGEQHGGYNEEQGGGGGGGGGGGVGDSDKRWEGGRRVLPGERHLPRFLSYSRILQTLKNFSSKHLQKDSERLKWLNFKTP